MLPIALVLFVASSALVTPSVQQSRRPIQDFGNNLISDAFALVDSDNSNIYILTIVKILNDLANQPDSYSRALAVSQTIAILGELSTGVPGDACVAANFINSNVAGRDAHGYLDQLASSIDSVAQLRSNPNMVGARGNCTDAGRTYQFEAAWEKILNNTTPYNIDLLNEEYSVAKGLYNAFNVRANNVGAAATAAALLSPTRAVQNAIGPLVNFLETVVNGGDASAAAAAAKQQLLS